MEEHTEKKTLAEDQKTYTKVKYIVRKRKEYTHYRKVSNADDNDEEEENTTLMNKA